MTTLEMMNKAAKTGETYITGDMRYSEKLGFHDENGHPWEADCFKYINNIIQDDEWSLLPPKMPPKRMTIKDIEEELGYEIELVYDNINCGESNPFYNSNVFISYKDNDEKRTLVELFPCELEEIVSQSQYLLRTVFGK